MAQRQTFEPSGRAIAYTDEGAGPGLVLLPALGLDPSYLSTLASVLVEEDFRVLRIGSRRPADDTRDAAAPVTMHDLAQDVVDVMHHVGLEHAWIGGHAFGGAIARTVAQDHHDHVNGVLLLGVLSPEAPGAPSASATPGAPDAEATRALATVLSEDATEVDALAAMEVLVSGADRARAAWNILERARDSEVALLQAAALAATPSEEWSALADGIPVLIVQGADDRVAPAAAAERLQSSEPALATLVRLDGAGHLFAMTHPGETSWVIEDYLDWD